MIKKSDISHAQTVLVSSLLACLCLAGCSGNRELLETPLAQSYFLPSPPLRVWKAVLLEASKPTRRILVNDEVAHLLSWVGDVEPDERLHQSLTDPKVYSEGDGTIAITVVRVDDAPGGAELSIRQTYCSGKPFFGVSPSRGNYEREVLGSIKRLLISETMDHEKH
jgi:hypothetical protein